MSEPSWEEQMSERAFARQLINAARDEPFAEWEAAHRERDIIQAAIQRRFVGWHYHQLGATNG